MWRIGHEFDTLAIALPGLISSAQLSAAQSLLPRSSHAQARAASSTLLGGARPASVLGRTVPLAERAVISPKTVLLVGFRMHLAYWVIKLSHE